MSDVYIRDPAKDLKYDESSGEYVLIVIPGIDNIDDSTTVRELEVNSTAYDIVGKGVLDQNSRTTNLEWIGTKAEYEALGGYSDKCTYIITDDYADSQPDEVGAIAEEVNTLKGYDYVVDWQVPTAANGYTWYRKYKSGWVEQGGINTQSTTGGNYTTIALPVAMSDKNYTIVVTKNNNDTSSTYGWGLRVATSLTTTTSFSVRPDSSGGFHWQASGMAA